MKDKTQSLVFIYITCTDPNEAKRIAGHLLKLRLIACANIIPISNSLYLWPPGENHIEESTESIIICKTIKFNWKAVEAEVKKLHSYTNPAILEIPLGRVTKKYRDWLLSEITETPVKNT